ncbi:MAG TPA: ActS/PrrB/RegB family redox-sensitive histidine kinase [Beijerinckiaceae bacterium]|nr:ActS/PrrB/RegB family redox-sensitive histidine kinase [Beijerinckiaceae bacterium]
MGAETKTAAPVVADTAPDQILRQNTLVRLRWLAVAGQLVSVLAVHFGFGFALPLAAALAVIAASVALNVGLMLGFSVNHRLSALATAAVLAFDIVQLAALLALTGGLSNPFSMLFLAPVMVSATVLAPRYTLLLGVLAAGLASLLAIWHWPLPWASDQPLTLPLLYRAGLWAAVLISLAFIATYTFKVADEARKLATALAATELVLEREQHLSTVAGLAAAAAHKLGTPLGTITLVAKELDLQVPAGHQLKDDITLIRQEAARCREILTNISALGRDDGGPLTRMAISQLVEELVAPYRPSDVVIDVRLDGPQPEPTLRRNPELFYALGNLIENALDFAKDRIIVRALWTSESISLSISDDGPGFSVDVIQRLGEPYVTTRRHRLTEAGLRRQVGGGHGLGLFISKTLLERGGGRIRWSNLPAPGGAHTEVYWHRSDFGRKFDQRG